MKGSRWILFSHWELGEMSPGMSRLVLQVTYLLVLGLRPDLPSTDLCAHHKSTHTFVTRAAESWSQMSRWICHLQLLGNKLYSSCTCYIASSFNLKLLCSVDQRLSSNWSLQTKHCMLTGTACYQLHQQALHFQTVSSLCGLPVSMSSTQASAFQRWEMSTAGFASMTLLWHVILWYGLISGFPYLCKKWQPPEV